MNVTVEDSGPCRKTLHIEIPKDRVEQEYKRVMGLFKKSAKIPGFRPGRAPDNLVKARFGKQIEEELKEQMIPMGYREALAEQKLNVVSIIDVKEVQFVPGEAMLFDVTLDVPPEFDLPEYKGLALQRNKVEVKEESVEQTLSEIREQFATFEDVTGRSVQAGDLVQVDYEGVADGTAIEEIDPSAVGLGSGKEQWVRTDEDSFLPGFGDGLIGAEIGEKRQIQVDFDDGFVVNALAGKKATYFADLRAIKEKKLPAIDQDFLEKLRVDSEEALREKIREDLENEARGKEDGRLKGEIVKKLMDEVKLDLPASQVDHETRNIIYDVVNQNAHQGASRDEIENNKDQIFESATRTANDKVKARYILNRIAEAEDISVSDEEFNQYLRVMAARYGMEDHAFRAELQKRDALENVRGDLLRTKTLENLLEQANITE